jgi:uncharacterized damage-inducible protein DinB
MSNAPTRPPIRPTEPLEILLAHDRWATGLMLDACDKLTGEQFHQPFDIGIGSLHNNLTHTIAAMRIWGDVLDRVVPRPWVDNTPHRTIAELRSMHAEAADQIERAAFIGPLDETFIRQRDDKVFTYSRGAILTHVTTHAMHHRAQCLNMLRRLGLTDLPESSVVQWSRSFD